MKKTAFILLTLVIMLFALTSVASAASSKSEYYSEIVSILDRIAAALSKNEVNTAKDIYQKELVPAVEGLSRLLINLNEANPKTADITGYTDKAIGDTVNWKRLIALAYEALREVCGVVTPNTIVEGASAHS